MQGQYTQLAATQIMALISPVRFQGFPAIYVTD
jgi:hypothetical protein